MPCATRSDPAVNDETVSVSDTVDLDHASRGLWVGTGGDVALILVDSTTPKTYKNVPDGTLLPFAVKRVMSTNTTASDMIAVR